MVTHQLGQGAVGKVFLGELCGANQQYAIKVIRKDKLADKPDSIKSVLLECSVLISANHPFLVSMNYFYTTDERVYFVMPFIGGGEMSTILKVEEKFSEKRTKFFVT